MKQADREEGGAVGKTKFACNTHDCERYEKRENNTASQY